MALHKRSHSDPVQDVHRAPIVCSAFSYAKVCYQGLQNQEVLTQVQTHVQKASEQHVDSPWRWGGRWGLERSRRQSHSSHGCGRRCRHDEGRRRGRVRLGQEDILDSCWPDNWRRGAWRGWTRDWRWWGTWRWGARWWRAWNLR